jgi:NAD(P)-dependent dehydrogenase (short-subunit alcohol dehydrogenase family)
MTVLITGASRGIGLEFVRNYLQQNMTVIATCRTPNQSTDLKELVNDFPDTLSVIQLDVTDDQSINDAYKQVKSKFSKIDLLINNAGIVSGGNARYNALGELHKENFLKVFATNSVAPILIMEKFLPLLKKGTNSKVINISSRMGSISLKSSSSTYSYDASKAALNMFTKSLSYRLKRDKISMVVFHPGWVRTRMGTEQAPLSKKTSVSGMIQVIDSLQLSDSGQFLDWEGKEVPW